MKTLKIIDFYSINNFHEIVNFSLLQCFSNIYSNVIYIVGKSAYENMQKLSTQNNIEFSNVTFKSKWVVELTHPLGALLRMLFGFFIFLKEYFMLKKGETIFYNYNNPFALPFIALLNRLFKKGGISFGGNKPIGRSLSSLEIGSCLSFCSKLLIHIICTAVLHNHGFILYILWIS